MRLISDELRVGLSDILDFELCLADAVPSVCLQLSLLLIFNNTYYFAPVTK